MSTSIFIRRQITQIRQGGRSVVARKLKQALRALPLSPLYLIAVLPILLIRLVRPFVLIRFGSLHSERIGVFTQVPEIHLCERDAHINQPAGKYIDIWYFGAWISNKQLALMWRRIFRVWPLGLIKPLQSANRLIPGGDQHAIKKNNARDTHNLFDRFPAHLQFTAREESFGQDELARLGVPKGSKFVCLLARDGSFQTAATPGKDWSYHDYRNMDVNRFTLVSRQLASLGCFVLRMGSVVKQRLEFEDPQVIDYATSGMRSDFMDIYLGAKCEFCVTVGSGWDGIPYIFRRPIVYVNLVPLGGIYTFSSRYINITKRHWSIKNNRELTLREIISRGLHLCYHADDYQSQGVTLIENTSDEIRDVTIEMFERLNGTWKPHKDDEALQKRFWEIFSKDAVPAFLGRPLHGEIRARFGAAFLRNNQWWLE